MGRLTTLLFGAALGAGLMFGALNYHAVRAADGFHFVPKLETKLDDAYVDIRQFGASDWERHRELALALIKANKEELIADSAISGIRTSMRSAFKDLIGSGR